MWLKCEVKWARNYIRGPGSIFIGTEKWQNSVCQDCQTNVGVSKIDDVSLELTH